MDFKEIQNIAKEAKINIEEGLQKLSIEVSKINPNEKGLNKEDYLTMLNELERAKKLKKELDERYSNK